MAYRLALTSLVLFFSLLSASQAAAPADGVWLMRLDGKVFLYLTVDGIRASYTHPENHKNRGAALGASPIRSRPRPCDFAPRALHSNFSKKVRSILSFASIPRPRPWIFFIRGKFSTPLS
jgi:hypothetical protein